MTSIKRDLQVSVKAHSIILKDKGRQIHQNWDPHDIITQTHTRSCAKNFKI